MRFTTKPEQVQAVQWNGGNAAAVSALAGGSEHLGGPVGRTLSVVTPEGSKSAKPGDWIVLDGDGLLDVVGEEAFAARFDPVP